MVRRFAKGICTAVRVAKVGFEKSFFCGECADSILGYTDPLTGIPNRKAFERDRSRFSPDHALVMIDIDNFKRINDSHGHAYGDEVLRRLAAILNSAVAPSGSAYRIAGDEFMCVIPACCISSVCTFIRNNVRKTCTVTVSQGVVTSLNKGFTQEVVVLADLALYRSKENGRNSVVAVSAA